MTKREPTSAADQRSAETWTLDNDKAQLKLGPWRAEIDLARLHSGLVNLAGPSGAIHGAELLGPMIPGLGHAESLSPSESFVRGDELVAVYETSGATPMRATFAWRAHRALPDGGDGLMIDLLVTLATEAFDVPAETIVRSQVAAEDALRYTNAAGQPMEPIGVRDRTATLHPSEGSLCVLLCGGSAPLSFVQTVHPAEGCTARLERAVDQPAVALRHTLFDWPLEKGVTLRSRVRAALVPADGAEQAAIACYDDLASQPPMLKA